MNTPENLVDLVNGLIKVIHNAINDRKSSTPRKNTWEKPEVWLDVITYLENLLQNYKNTPLILAKIILGLDKYLDYFSLDWATNIQIKDIKNLSNKAVRNALYLYTLVQIQKFPCGQHEDNACILGQLSPRFTSSHSSLPLHVAVNFWSPYISKIDLNKYPCLTIMRVIDDKNDPYGSYWFIGNLPKTRTCWRSHYAVLTQWSKGTKYVKLNINHNITQNIECWLGFAASQPIPSEECILYGGWHQAWIEPNIMNQLKSFVTKPQNINHW